MPLASYSSDAQNPTNVYEFVNRIHNILFGAEASTSLDAVKDALPIIAYVSRKVQAVKKSWKRLWGNSDQQVILVGPPGVGKTHYALWCAHKFTDQSTNARAI
jgi:DNA replication protein DnaC